MEFFRPTVIKILITLCFFFYTSIISLLQVIPLIAEWRNTLIYPFTQFANFLISLFHDNTILGLLSFFTGQIVLYYFLSCCIVAFVVFLKHETPNKQAPRK